MSSKNFPVTARGTFFLHVDPFLLDGIESPVQYSEALIFLVKVV